MRSSVHAEIRHVSVTAAHDFDPSRRACGGVGGHHRCRTSVERKGGAEHPSKTPRDEFGYSGGVLSDQNLSGRSRRGSQLCESAQRGGFSQRPTACHILAWDFQIDQAFTQHPWWHLLSVLSPSRWTPVSQPCVPESPLNSARRAAYRRQVPRGARPL